MAVEFKVTDNSGKTLEEFERAAVKALEMCGLLAEGYAKKKTPVRTDNLRGSITHMVDSAKSVAYIGTDVKYAIYVETGTRKQKAQPYLKPAVADHASEYREIIESTLKNG